MLENLKELKRVTSSVIAYIKESGITEIVEILSGANVYSEVVSNSGWDDVYNIFLEVDIYLYHMHHSLIDKYEEEILSVYKIFLRGNEDESINSVIIRPLAQTIIDWSQIEATKKQVESSIEMLKYIVI